jgi:transposase InsO family protein
MSLERRQFITNEITRLCQRTGIALLVLLKYAGISMRTWQEWAKRKNEETRHNNNIPRINELTPAEIRAIVDYCRVNARRGYRPLCWEMVDANIAFVSPSSVYNVIKQHNLGQKWQEAKEVGKKGFEQPQAVHEQWHIDFSYIKICGAFYYFISILDGYSRRILDWRLCENMEGINAELIVARTKELYPLAKNPRLISDNAPYMAAVSSLQKTSGNLLNFWKWSTRSPLPIIRKATANWKDSIALSKQNMSAGQHM